MKRILMIAALACACDATLADELLQVHLATPVLLKLSSGQEASGFYVNDSNCIFLVTARHVLFERGGTNLLAPTCTALSWTHDFSSSNHFLLQLHLTQQYADGELRRHPDRDLAVLRIGTMTNQLPSQFNFIKDRRYVEWLQKPVPDSPLVALSLDMFQTFTNALISRDVFIFGYPSSLGIQQVPQLEHDRPLLRKGILAGKNYSRRMLVVDAPVFYGNSGGPVLEMDTSTPGVWRLKLLGTVSEFVPFEEDWLNLRHGIRNVQISNSGYAVVEPVDALLEMIKGFAP